MMHGHEKSDSAIVAGKPTNNGGWVFQSDPYRGASNLTGRSRCVNQEAPKYGPRVKRIAGGSGVPSCSELGEGHVGIEVLDRNDDRAPRVAQAGFLDRSDLDLC